ncbi:MAG TPA: thiamine pyrophosphate-dependent enzyme [Dehalococcoidia bacterium]|nr:thiamine pyrophosphate-dependent enzyme [Dehalococcoidia bacterium]
MTESFPLSDPIWCAGCGHFAVVAGLEAALARCGVAREDVLVVAGIGCSGTLQNYVEANGYHALHGRVLPTAAGAKLANPDLCVVGAGGDGDGLAIGVGHLVHAFRTNPSVVYLLMNNGTYGLTKGQPSPTSQADYSGARDEPVDPIKLGLAFPNSSFLARGYSGAPDQLAALTSAAITHAADGRGFAFLEILSPCVAYNDRYTEWPSRIVNVDDDSSYDPADPFAAGRMVEEQTAAGKMPSGLIFQRERSDAPGEAPPSPAGADIGLQSRESDYAALMATFQVRADA